MRVATIGSAAMAARGLKEVCLVDAIFHFELLFNITRLLAKMTLVKARMMGSRTAHRAT